MCDSLGITPKPNNGTLRLPLKPVGFHSQDGGVNDPLEPSLQSEITVQPISEPTVFPPGMSDAQPSDPVVSDNNQIPSDDDQELADAEHYSNPSNGWWSSLKKEFDAAKAWLSQTFTSGNVDNTPE